MKNFDNLVNNFITNTTSVTEIIKSEYRQMYDLYEARGRHIKTLYDRIEQQEKVIAELTDRLEKQTSLIETLSIYATELSEQVEKMETGERSNVLEKILKEEPKEIPDEILKLL